MRALGEVRGAAKLTGLPPLTRLSCLAVTALFVPTFYKLFSFGWNNADYSHGPLVLAAFCWLLWQKRNALLAHPHPCLPLEREGAQTSPLPEGEGQGGGTQPEAALKQNQRQIPPVPPSQRGGRVGSGRADKGALFDAATFALLLFGAACYGIGSVHGSMAIEAFSMVPVLLGTAGFLLGKRILKALLFPVLFLLFLVPPPLVVTDLMTAPLKMLVATASASLLKTIGYLVTRSGATILMSDYSITVGDPCSGMRSLIALMSVGALYAHLLQSTRVKKGVLFLSTIPISVFANVVRLMVLCLITYHFGEAAAEGFLHKFSGFVLFVVSLVSLFLFDLALHRRSVKR
jgi:exosortase